MRFTSRSALVIGILVMAIPAAAQNGLLKVTSFPSGAAVAIDGISTGKVTPMSTSVTIGDHLVTVSIPNSGWSPDTRTVTVVSGNNDLSITLLPVMTVGPQGPKGDKGDPGEPGLNGTNGTNGTDGTSVTFVGYFAGDEHGCPNGGAVFAAAGGALAYVCNGMNGSGAAGARAAAPCFDNVNRYVDCRNGTVTDTVTGLIWLKHADCLGGTDWATANQIAVALKNGDCSLTDGSSPGDWRLPTKAEWDATIARAAAMGCRFGGPFEPPSLTIDEGTGCYFDGSRSSLVGVAVGFYWSSSTPDQAPHHAWGALLGSGETTHTVKFDLGLVWPVRGGNR